MNDSTPEERVLNYARRNGLVLTGRIGAGMDGDVWESNRQTAIKAIHRQQNYIAELECYQRFAEHNVRKVNGFAVPRLVGHDDELAIVEIEIVSPPYIIDFAKCRFDTPFDFSPEVMADWNEAGSEIFEDRWRQVKSLLRAL
jgi:hypothetical protein